MSYLSELVEEDIQSDQEDSLNHLKLGPLSPKGKERSSSIFFEEKSAPKKVNLGLLKEEEEDTKIVDLFRGKEVVNNIPFRTKKSKEDGKSEQLNRIEKKIDRLLEGLGFSFP